MTGPARSPGTADQAIGSYLAEIAAGLPGPASARRDILAELGAGVADSADAYRRAGLNPAQAARSAIAEFGSPDRVAAGFRTELAAAQARRTALTLMIIGPLTGILWFTAALASHIGRLAPPWEWAGSLATVDIAMLAALTILAATTPGSLAALPVAAAAAASLARLSLAARAARNCLTLRAAYPAATPTPTPSRWRWWR